MSDVLARLVSAFVSDAVPAPAARRPARRAAGAARSGDRALPSAVGVLCAPGDLAAAFAVGVVLAARGTAGCAVVCRWTGAASAPPADAFAFPAGAAVARRLRDRGLPATGVGRLVVVDLEPAPDEARSTAARVAVGAGDVPVVIALAGARSEAFDDLLAAQDRLLVAPGAGAPEGLADVALLDAARAGRAASLLALTWSGAGRALGTRGLGLPRAVRAATAAALEGRDA